MAAAAATKAGVCAVLGAGGDGIGGHVAERFAKAGFAVALLGRTKEKLAALEAKIRSGGGSAQSFVADAASPDSIKLAFADIKQSVGAVDVLVYNAGPQFQRVSILDLDPKASPEPTKRFTAVAIRPSLTLSLAAVPSSPPWHRCWRTASALAAWARWWRRSKSCRTCWRRARALSS